MTSVASPPPASSPGPEGLRLSPSVRCGSAVPSWHRCSPRRTTSSTRTSGASWKPPTRTTSSDSSFHATSRGEPRSAYRAAAALLAVVAFVWRAGPRRRPRRCTCTRWRRAQSRTRGLVGAVGLTPPEAGIVLPHENTMAGPGRGPAGADRGHRRPTWNRSTWSTRAAARRRRRWRRADVDTAAGVGDRGRRDAPDLGADRSGDAAARSPADLLPRRAVIADGHHRYATYLRHQADRHAAGDGAGPWDRGLALLVDASTYGPQVHAIHRFVPGLAAGRRGQPGRRRLRRPGRAGRRRRWPSWPPADKGAGVPAHRRRSRWVLLTDPDPAQVDVRAAGRAVRRPGGRWT